MRGAPSRFRRLASLTVACVVAASTALGAFSPRAEAFQNLDQARDNVGTILPGFLDVTHDIYFVLPVTAPQVTPSDYIIVDFPNYTNVRPPTSVIGGYGTATWSVVGSKVRITNVAILPGTGFNIQGIVANNPGGLSSNQVIISIAENAAGTIIRNQSTVIPTDTNFSVNVTASIVSDLSALRISGFGPVGGFVTLTENSTPVGTTVAGGTGAFVFQLTAIDPGIHTYQIYATDSLNRSTSQTSLSLFLIAGNLTTASNILLSSSMSLDKAEITSGQTLVISGSTKPSTQLNLFLESPLQSFTIPVDSTGNWSYTLSSSFTQALTPGEYRVYSVVQDILGYQSNISNTLSFTVRINDPTNPAPCGDISRGDLNCDSRVNLTDFSILLYYWNTNQRRGDINSDGKVNLTDFSIMMFYYGS